MRVALPPGNGEALRGEGRGCQNRRVLNIGLIALGVSDVRRAADFWCEALGYELREDGFGDGARASRQCRDQDRAAAQPDQAAGSTRACTCTWTCTWPMRPSRLLKWRAWCR
jgi:hypothetical protein